MEAERKQVEQTQKADNLWRAIWNPRMLICIFNGFAAGMPLYYLLNLIPAWLRTEGASLKTIALFALVGFPYSWKFLWAPFMDRYVPRFLGRRRGWMLITQIALFLCMLSFAFFQPKESVWIIFWIALALAFFSASQDIVLDAYRRELLPDRELGLGNAMYTSGYRASIFIPGSLGFILADHISWPLVHFVIACFMFIGIAKTLLIKEAAVNINPPKSINDAVVKPFKEFFARDGVIQAILIMFFLVFYKIGDNMATALSTPFYLDIGFSLTAIGMLAKYVGVGSMIAGSFIGGIVIFKIGINRALWIFGFVQMVTILGFALLSEVGANKWVFAAVISGEYLGVGMGAAALIAFMARATNINFTATQFALLTSLMAVPRIFANATTGILVEGVTRSDGIYYRLFGEISGMGYTKFFFFCTLMAIPGIVLLKWVAPWNEKK